MSCDFSTGATGREAAKEWLGMETGRRRAGFFSVAQPEEVVLFSHDLVAVKLKDVERVCLGPEGTKKGWRGRFSG